MLKGKFFICAVPSILQSQMARQCLSSLKVLEQPPVFGFSFEGEGIVGVQL